MAATMSLSPRRSNVSPKNSSLASRNPPASNRSSAPNWSASMGRRCKTNWGEIASLEYGKALRGYQNQEGSVQVFGTNGPVGWTDQAQSQGPGVIIGRKGAYRGVHYSAGPFWVIDT